MKETSSPVSEHQHYSFIVQLLQRLSMASSPRDSTYLASLLLSALIFSGRATVVVFSQPNPLLRGIKIKIIKKKKQQLRRAGRKTIQRLLMLV